MTTSTLSNPAFHQALHIAYGARWRLAIISAGAAKGSGRRSRQHDRVLAGERFNVVDHITNGDAEAESSIRDVEYRLSPIKVDGDWWWLHHARRERSETSGA